MVEYFLDLTWKAVIHNEDHNEEEASLAGVLQQLPVLVCPLLVVTVRQVVDSQGVPLIQIPANEILNYYKYLRTEIFPTDL